MTRDEATGRFMLVESDLVLDMGCGPTYFPRADILADINPDFIKYYKNESNIFVAADIHYLPFGDNIFDFVWCSHVLEHVTDPVQACKELIRVGERGRIVTPSKFKEMFFPLSYHYWFVYFIDDTLIFEKKYGFIESPEWKRVLDTQAMKDFKNSPQRRNIPDYEKETIFDWFDTFKMVVKK